MWQTHRRELLTGIAMLVITVLLYLALGEPNRRHILQPCASFQEAVEICTIAAGGVDDKRGPRVFEPDAWWLENIVPRLLHTGDKVHSRIRGVMVVGCYVIVTIAYIFIIIQGYRLKTFGMPVIPSAATMALCYLCGFYGPWSDYSYLFFPADGKAGLLFVWRLWFFLQGLILIQYLLYERPPRGIGLGRAATVFWGLFWLVLSGLLEMTYIVFYQDYYVNEICFIVVFVAAFAYLTFFIERPEHRGLSVTVAYMLLVGNALLNAAVVWGEMTDPYRYKLFGFGFIYVLFAAILVGFLFYAVLLSYNRRGRRPWRGWWDWFLRDIGWRDPLWGGESPAV